MNVMQKWIFTIRAMLINRQINALLRHTSRPHAPSAHLVGHVAVPPTARHAPDHGGSAWFIALAMAAAFGAGCVVAGEHAAEERDRRAPHYGISACVYTPVRPATAAVDEE